MRRYAPAVLLLATGCSKTVLFGVTMTDVLDGNGVSGAQVCFEEPADVGRVFTDSNGYAEIDVPASTDKLTLTATARGYVDVLAYSHTIDVDVTDHSLSMLSVSDKSTLRFDPGEQMDDSKGQIILFAQDYHPVTAYAQNRITASLHPASGTLYIFDRDGMLWEHGGVISTTGSGLLGFLNVNPGNTTLKVGRDAAVGGGCTGVETWAGFTGSQDIEVRANTVTSIVVQCFVPDGGRREAARSEPEPRRMVRPGR